MLVRFLFALFLGLAVGIPSYGIEVDWDGSAGDEDDPQIGDGIHWHDPFNWDTDSVPGLGDDADVGMGHPLILENELFMIVSLAVGEDGGLDIRGTLNTSGTSIENDGEIFIDNGSAPGPAALGVGVATLEGSGEIILGDSDFTNSGARLAGPSVGGSATHAAGHTIRGEGTISGNWINNGLIKPEDISGDSTGTLRITGAMTNNGTLQTSATANLLFNINITQGATGQIIADENKVIFSGVTITGGTLDSINGGIIEGNFGTSRLNQVHNKGLVHMTGNFGSTLRIEGGGITNDGTIVIASDPAAVSSIIFGSGNNELSGSGEVILNRSGLNARIQTADATTVAINGSAHTIRGIGAIDATMINNGTIIAEPRDEGNMLEIHDANSDSTFTNNNVIRAVADSVLRLRNILLSQNDATGRIIANEGTVELQSGQLNQPLIDGGRLETVGAGTIEVIANTRIDNVTNEGTLNIQPGKVLRIGGTTFTNNGSVIFQSVNGPVFNAAQMVFGDGVVLDGDGEFFLTNTSGPVFHAFSVDNGASATQASGHTIRGEGVMNCCGNLGTFINNGRIEGTSADDDIEINGTLGGSGVLKNVQIGGTHSPGESTAIVSIEGAYTLKTFSHLEMEIGGTTPGSGYDQLLSTDPTNVITIGTTDTTLAVSLINGFVPSLGNTFTLLSTVGSINGHFEEIDLPLLPSGLAWNNVSTSQSIAYQVVTSSGIPGDFDMDGDVDGRDFLVWQRNPSVGNLTDWQANYGVGSLAASASVPEPGTFAIFCLAALATARWRPS